MNIITAMLIQLVEQCRDSLMGLKMVDMVDMIALDQFQ